MTSIVGERRRPGEIEPDQPGRSGAAEGSMAAPEPPVLEGFSRWWPIGIGTVAALLALLAFLT